MANDYYSHDSGLPAPQTRAIAEQVQAELDEITTGFNKLPGVAQMWGGSANYARDVGVINALSIPASANLTAFADGMRFTILPATTNTDAATLTVGTLGTVALVQLDSSALQAGDIQAGEAIEVIYNSDTSKFHLLSTEAAASAAQAAASAAAAAASAAAATNAENVYGTSTSSVAIPTDITGSVSFTYVETSRTIALGMYIIAADAAAPATNTVTFQVTAWNSSTKVVIGTVVAYQGSGTKSSWVLSLTGAPSRSGQDFLVSLTASGTTVPKLTTNVPSGKQMVVVSAANVSVSSFATTDGWSVDLGGNDLVTSTYAGVEHGVWGTLTMTPPGASVSLSSTATLISTVQLSSTLALAFFLVSGLGPYVVAINLTNNTVGTAVSLGFGGTFSAGLFAYATSSTNFVVAGSAAAATQAANARAGSVSGTVVTLGSLVNFTAVATGTAVVNECIKLSSSQYVAKINGDSDGLLGAFSVSGTTVTMGTGIAIASVDDTEKHDSRLLPIDATTFLMGYLAAGGGTSSTRLFSARVGSIAANAITLGTAQNTGSNTEADAGVIVAAKLGSSYVFGIAKGAGTSGDVRAITVSGTTPTIGAASNQTGEAFTTPTKYVFPTYYNPPAAKWMVLGSTLLLSNGSDNNLQAVTASGSTASVGSTFAPSGTSAVISLLQTVDGVTAYASSTGRFDKLSLAGTTITSAEQVTTSGQANFIPTTSISNKAVKYNSTWYRWAIPAVAAGGALSASQAIFGGSGTTQVYSYTLA